MEAVVTEEIIARQPPLQPDRAKMYWSLGCLQWCWAHLRRDFVKTMLTIIETCRQQGRNTFTFVADAVHAHLAACAPASLLAGA